mmetsp:Transcript_55491/g.159546  ORF Transcript_55491/g.159546 Transcript_55491/m.159546 type:complete len:212 (+) Transcript_55491:1726-2361(+)
MRPELLRVPHEENERHEDQHREHEQQRQDPHVAQPARQLPRAGQKLLAQPAAGVEGPAEDGRAEAALDRAGVDQPRRNPRRKPGGEGAMVGQRDDEIVLSHDDIGDLQGGDIVLHHTEGGHALLLHQPGHHLRPLHGRQDVVREDAQAFLVVVPHVRRVPQRVVCVAHVEEPEGEEEEEKQQHEGARGADLGEGPGVEKGDMSARLLGVAR